MKIIDNNGVVLHEGPDHEMRKAFQYLTVPGWQLTQYVMRDFYELNRKYYTDTVRAAKRPFRLVK